jgi:hypothetical protein
LQTRPTSRSSARIRAAVIAATPTISRKRSARGLHQCLDLTLQRLGGGLELLHRDERVSHELGANTRVLLHQATGCFEPPRAGQCGHLSPVARA